jgi:hypothetical protein
VIRFILKAGAYRGSATSVLHLRHPTVPLLLFVPDELTLVETELGCSCCNCGRRSSPKRAGRGYLGYLRAQKELLLGARGQKRVNRPELVEAHGFDTKYAMHALRLGWPCRLAGGAGAPP